MRIKRTFSLVALCAAILLNSAACTAPAPAGAETEEKEEYLFQPFNSDLLSCFSPAYLPVLAVYASQIASRKEYGA